MPTLRSQSVIGGAVSGKHRQRKQLLRVETSRSESDEFSPPKRPKNVIIETDAVLGPSILCSTPPMFSRPMLQRAISNPTLEEEQWLSAAVMNLILTRIAERYQNIVYFSEQFSFLKLSSEDFLILEDVLGRKISDLKHIKEFVWLINNGNVHWSLARAIVGPVPQLELFDPLGNVSRRKRPNNRQIPRNILRWLDSTFPCTEHEHDCWQLHAMHAVTASHQKNSFDCGVACLLYAEKCGTSQSKEQIDEGTTQSEITSYRREIQGVVRDVTSLWATETPSPMNTSSGYAHNTFDASPATSPSSLSMPPPTGTRTMRMKRTRT